MNFTWMVFEPDFAYFARKSELRLVDEPFSIRKQGFVQKLGTEIGCVRTASPVSIIVNYPFPGKNERQLHTL